VKLRILLVLLCQSITIFEVLSNSARFYLKKFLEETGEHFVHFSVGNPYKRPSLNNNQSKDPSRSVTPTYNKILRSNIIFYKLFDTSYLLYYFFAQRLERVWSTFQIINIIALEFTTNTFIIQLLKRTDIYILREMEYYNSTFITSLRLGRWTCHFSTKYNVYIYRNPSSYTHNLLLVISTNNYHMNPSVYHTVIHVRLNGRDTQIFTEISNSILFCTSFSLPWWHCYQPCAPTRRLSQQTPQLNRERLPFCFTSQHLNIIIIIITLYR